MNKILSILLLACIVSFNVKTSDAGTLSATLTDDSTYTAWRISEDPQFDWVANYRSNQIPSWYTKDPNDWNGVNAVAFLKFQLPQNIDLENFESAKLDMYSYNSNSNSTFRMSMHSDDNWSENSKALNPNFADIDGNFYLTPSISIIDDYLTKYTWSINGDFIESNNLSDKLFEIVKDGYITLGISGIPNSENDYVDEDFLSKEYDNAADFDPDEINEMNYWNQNILGTGDKYAPKLTFSTFDNPVAPVPEPSSFILGLMSLCGLTGLKKRKKLKV